MDTNKMRDISREQFEAWHRSVVEGEPPHEKYNNGDYRNQHVQRYWIGWQASREAVVVKLPAVTDELLTAAYWDFDARRMGYPPYAAPAGQECGAFKVAIVSAIEAQGLKCQVKP